MPCNAPRLHGGSTLQEEEPRSKKLAGNRQPNREGVYGTGKVVDATALLAVSAELSSPFPTPGDPSDDDWDSRTELDEVDSEIAGTISNERGVGDVGRPGR